jgi:hypothetical protein
MGHARNRQFHRLLLAAGAIAADERVSQVQVREAWQASEHFLAVQP